LVTFDIKNQWLKSFVYEGLLIATPIVIIWNAIIVKGISKKIFCLTLPILMLLFILYVGPLQFMFSSGAWRTQTILYQNGHLSFKRVEFQMQDVGALGYNRRTVEVLYLTPLFMITTSVPQNIDKHVEWIRVDEEINELNLNSP
jgi:hypothetical protein